jgi:hypothetical protein
VAEVTSASGGEVVAVARADISGLPPEAAAAPPRLNLKETRISRQSRASKQILTMNRPRISKRALFTKQKREEKRENIKNIKNSIL